MNDQHQTNEHLRAELEEAQRQLKSLEAQRTQLEQVAAYQRQIHDCLPVLVATAGMDGYYQQVNAAFERILGWSEQESLSRPFMEFIYPDDRAAAVAALERLKVGDQAVIFLDRNVCKDGSHRWINWIVIPVPERNMLFGIGQDITDRKLTEDERDRAAEAVRQSEQRMRLHVEQTPLAVMEWDLQLCVSKWNPAAERIFGYTAAEAVGRHFGFLIPPALRGQIDHLWTALHARRGGERSTNENIARDGRTILCEWYNTPLVNADGHIVGFASLAQDITEQTRAEAALRDSERRLATVISNLPGAVYRCKADAPWTIEFLSDGYRALTGYDPSQLIGQPGTRHSDLIHSDDRQRELEAMQQAIAEKRHYQVEYRMRTATGQEKWVWEQGTGVYSPSGELEAIEGFTTDVTVRKEAEAAIKLAHDELEQRIKERTAALKETNERLQQEMQERHRTLEALRQSEAKYRALIESSPDAVAMIDLQGQIIFASPRAAEYHGAAHPDELLGRQATDLVAETDRQKFRANVQSLLASGIQRNKQYRAIGKGGRIFDVEISSAVIRDAAGDPEALMGIYRDITKRRRGEKKLKRERQALRRMVMAGDHERHLIAYEIHDGVAQQLVAALIQLQSIAARQTDRSAVAEPTYREVIDTLRSASAELRMLMSRLRTPVLDKFGLAEAIADVAAQLRSVPGAPDIEYHCAVQFQRLEPTLENSLFRIAQEAMTNAARHSQSEKIRVQLTQQANELTLEVRDWGIGFDREAVAENRFGLEGIHERTRLLGGKLRIKSQLGKGTRIRVKCPVIERTPTQ